MAGRRLGGLERLMRISLNLATRPFIEIRPLLARLRLAMALLAVLALGLGVWLHTLNRKAAAAVAQMDAAKERTALLQRERQANEARMRQPKNQAVLERSRFLNDVFMRKSFSWTAVMMDLERVLPGGVQVTSIEPQVSTTDGTVTIRLRVSGDRDRAVQLVRNLEGSARFVHPRLSNEAAQASDREGRATVVSDPSTVVPGAVEFDILSGYNPLPELRKAAGGAAADTLTKETEEHGASAATAKVPAHRSSTLTRGGQPRGRHARDLGPAAVGVGR